VKKIKLLDSFTVNVHKHTHSIGSIVLGVRLVSYRRSWKLVVALVVNETIEGEISGAILLIIIDIFLLRADGADISATLVVVVKSVWVETSLGTLPFRIGRDFDCVKFSDIKMRLSYVVFWVNLFSMSLCGGSEITSPFIEDTFPSNAAHLLKEALFSLRNTQSDSFACAPWIPMLLRFERIMPSLDVS